MFRISESVKLKGTDPSPQTCGTVVRVTLQRITVAYDDGVQGTFRPDRFERWPKLGEERYNK
jgi:hypothetical protein